MKRVLAGASSRAGVTNRRDQYHKVASTHYRQLETEEALIIGSCLTGSEALSILKSRAFIEKAERPWEFFKGPV